MAVRKKIYSLIVYRNGDKKQVAEKYELFQIA